VRLVTARTILLAAMAAFFADVRLGFSITDRASATMMVVVDRWFNELPSVSRQLLATPNRGGSVVSELLQSLDLRPQQSQIYYNATRDSWQFSALRALLHSVWNLGDVACAVARLHQEEWKNRRFWRSCRSRRSRLPSAKVLAGSSGWTAKTTGTVQFVVRGPIPGTAGRFGTCRRKGRRS
jgi:hypothetical protein